MGMVHNFLQGSNLDNTDDTVSVAVTATLIELADANRWNWIFVNLSANRIVVRWTSGATLTAGIEVPSRAAPVILNYEDVGDIVQTTWWAIASVAASELWYTSTILNNQ